MSSNKSVYDRIYKHKPVQVWLMMLFILGGLVATPFVIAALFNVSVWVPIATLAATSLINFIANVWRNYVDMSIVTERSSR